MNLLECNHLRMTFAWCDKPSRWLASLTNCTRLLSELIELSSHELSVTDIWTPGNVSSLSKQSLIMLSSLTTLQQR